ncbi:MAG: PorV/PorQ family protein [Bacteroidetes bacterium]|nr:PorV/PorQ family protein [Bacteroidota bacterium]MCW5894771.1 PorV/PorQ family protein [Bacteroidota bacterium]
MKTKTSIKPRFITAISSFVLLLFHVFAHGQTGVNNSGASGAQFLTIGVGARAMGMGGAYTTIADDPTALYWNPAGISRIDRTAFVATHTNWVADIAHDFAGLVFPLSSQFKVGAGVILLNSGDIEITTIEQPRGTGQTYTAKDLAAIAAVGWAATEQLSFGASLKYLRNEIYSLSSSGIAFDAGTQFNTEFHGLHVALSVSNLSAKRNFSGPGLEFQQVPPFPGADPIRASYYNTPFALPLTYRAGVASELFEAFGQKSESQRLLVAVDVAQTSDNPEKFHIGAEYAWNNTLILRSGYIFNAVELGLNLGLGVRWNSISWAIYADYAFADIQRFSSGHRFSIGIVL